jgi:hypothetical protein
MKAIAQWSLAFALLLADAGGLPAAAAADEPQESIAPVSLTSLARDADFVGLARVKDTDYLRRRDLPVSGSAYLEVLITYKSEAAEDIIEVYEKGLHEGECYFPNPSVFEEGRRYLLFLRRDAEDAERYRGLPAGCAIDVLVDRNNRYAVRMPVTGIALTDALEELARPMQFSDPHAVVDDDALPAALRDAMQAAGQIVPQVPEGGKSNGEGVEPAGVPPPAGKEPPARQWLYTQGVPLSEFRELLRMEPEL